MIQTCSKTMNCYFAYLSVLAIVVLVLFGVMMYRDDETTGVFAAGFGVVCAGIHLMYRIKECVR